MYKDDLFDRLIAVGEAVVNCQRENAHFLPAGYEYAHNVGRLVEVAYLLEQTTGFAVPGDVERGMLVNLRAMMNNPYALLVNDPEIFGAGVLNYHNLREALLALSVLAEHKDSRWARRTGETLLDTIDRRFFEGTLTDGEICAATGLSISDDPMLVRPADDPYRFEDDTPTTGRAIEGMLRFHQATGSQRALSVLQKAVCHHRAHSLRADGSAPEWLTSPDHVGHNHSYLGTLRGLLLYGIHSGDRGLIGEIHQTFLHTVLRHCVTPSGFAPHDQGTLRFPDQLGDPWGDHASCADAAYIAFLLASRCGYPELLDDTERLIRARLFRCQIAEGAQAGAWGTYGGYFGEGWTVDVFALIAGTLGCMYRDMIEEADDSVTVRLHFSGESPALSLKATRDARQKLSMTVRARKKLLVRIPAWCCRDSIRLSDESGRAPAYAFEGTFLVIQPENITPGRRIELEFDLPERETHETTFVSRTEYRLLWRGDSLIETEILEGREHDPCSKSALTI